LKAKENKTQQTKAGMIEALKVSLGVISDACKICGINRWTHYDWVKTDPEYKKQVEELSDLAFEFVESQLFKVIKGYSMPEDKIFQYEGSPVIVPTKKNVGPDTQAITFYLRTKGRKKGYVERTEVTGADGEKLFPEWLTNSIPKEAKGES